MSFQGVNTNFQVVFAALRRREVRRAAKPVGTGASAMTGRDEPQHVRDISSGRRETSNRFRFGAVCLVLCVFTLERQAYVEKQCGSAPTFVSSWAPSRSKFWIGWDSCLVVTSDQWNTQHAVKKITEENGV